MKAITVYLPHPGSPLPRLTLYADSAIQRDVSPLFIPDTGVAWKSRVCLAVRVERLGKNIPEKFARRYLDAMSLVNVIYPDPADPASAAFMASGAMHVLDSAVVTGRWLPLVEAGEPAETTVNGNHATFAPDQMRIEAVLSAVSAFATVKTGDVLMLGDCAVEVPLTPNTRITASIGAQQCLNVKIK